MIKYEYKNPFWLYEAPNLWARIKHEAFIVLTIFAGTGILLLIALHN